MPIQKDLKRLVRSRMKKTGESYTAARHQIIKKSPAREEPPPNYAEIAGMSDAAIEKNTGRTWAQWVKTLDAVRAAEMPHREIAQYVHSLGTGSWWSQSVTVGYERIRGLREIGQRRDGGYEANKSRVFPVSVERLFEAFADARTRKKWMPHVALRVRSATKPKTMSLDLEDGTRVVVGFDRRGETKAQVAIQHSKLKSKEQAAQSKVQWGERFDALGAVLAKQRRA